MRISDWSPDVCSSDLLVRFVGLDTYRQAGGGVRRDLFAEGDAGTYLTDTAVLETLVRDKLATLTEDVRAEGWAWVEAVPHLAYEERQAFQNAPRHRREPTTREARRIARSEEHTSELQSLMRISYAVFCLKKKIIRIQRFTFYK